MPNFKVKANERDNQITRDVLDDNCHCYALGCCPFAFLKLEDVTGTGKDYFWNEAGVMVSGTKEEMKVAAAALKSVTLKTEVTNKK